MSASTRSSSTAASSKPLYSAQASLPQLPVPPLEQTLSKYLRSTAPLQTSAESTAVTEAAVQAALNGKDAALMKTLQERLQKRATAEGRESWLSEWWLSAAYMTYRDPVVPFSSYFYLHKADPKVKSGVTRAAHLLKAMMAFRELVVSEKLTPEPTKDGYLCMAPYKWMFNSCRYPVDAEDVSKSFDPATNNHVIVMRRGHFFAVDLVHPQTGRELSVQEIEVQLKRIVDDARTQKVNETPIGALTAADRDAWTKNYAALTSGSNGEANRAVLEKIASAVMVLNLDDANVTVLEERGRLVYGGDAKNRFFDKQQLVVADNGESGYVGEHSMMDGSQTLRLNNFMLSSLEAGKIQLDGPSCGAVLAEPAYLSFQVESNLASAANSASEDFVKLMAAQDMSVLNMSAYGKGAIKKYKCSPDAWAQMCIQLAFYKMYGRPCATYEAAQTRKFKLGRTETIRSASIESLAFCQAMTDPSASDADRLAKFQQAAAQHIKYAKDAAEGQGVDRHLFGLKRMLQSGEELPSLFQDPMNATSGTWILSTSQISAEVFDAWGFGEVTPKGFGVAYCIKEKSLAFTLMCLKDEHSASKFTHYLHQACIELRDLHDRIGATPKL